MYMSVVFPTEMDDPLVRAQPASVLCLDAHILHYHGSKFQIS